MNKNKNKGTKQLSFIEIKNATYYYGDPAEGLPPALDGLTLSIAQGEIVAVLGHNGSGKSTLAHHLNGMEIPCSGDVLVGGINTREEERAFEIRSRVGLVLQNPDNQIVATIVEEDVAFGPENLGVPPKEIRARVEKALRTVDMLVYKDHAPHKLSGGQKQRVAIAGVLAMEPDCIVLDEPTAMLDPKGRKEVLDTVHKLNKENNMTVVLITHSMEEAARADRIVVMSEGKMVLQGSPEQVFGSRERLQEVRLDSPKAAVLAQELRDAGIPLPDGILTPRTCAKAIADLIERK